MLSSAIESNLEPTDSAKTNISIANIRKAKSFEWDTIWNECTYSTYFHSREWAEIWSDYTKGKTFPTPFMITFSDGKKALLPFSCLLEAGIMPALLGTKKMYLSSPECTYGGWISSDKLDSNHAVLLLRFIKTKFSNFFWRMNPYDDLALKSNIKISDEGETHAINLRKGFEFIATNMSRDHRRAVKKANQNGITVRIASSIKDWRDYYQVYEDTVGRWGNRLLGEKYSWSLFEDMFYRHSSNIELWLATHQNKVIAGALFFHSKKHFDDWHSAAIEASLNLKPVNLLLYEVIKHACEKGYDWFDFNPSAGLQGVRSFKEGFGAEALKCPIVRLIPKNMRTFAIEKVNDKVIELKRRVNCPLSTPFFKKQINDW